MRERRHNRTTNRKDALAYLLAKRAQERGSQALVVGTHDGLVVASPPGFDGDLAAAFGASRALGRTKKSVLNMDATTMDFEGETLVITAIGGPPLGSGELSSDVGRILRAA